jgi:hypothetical protein
MARRPSKLNPRVKRQTPFRETLRRAAYHHQRSASPHRQKYRSLGSGAIAFNQTVDRCQQPSHKEAAGSLSRQLISLPPGLII